MNATVDTFDKGVAKDIQTIADDSYLSEILNNFGEHLVLPGGVDGILQLARFLVYNPKGLKYFMKNAENYADSGYQHTPEDLLRNRVKTTGIVEVTTPFFM